MSVFLKQLTSGLESCGAKNARCLLAVSGGADSVALLRGMVELGSHILDSICVGHLNHRLRGSASDDDSRWLVDLCRRLSVECIVEEAAVAAVSNSRRSGIEETARHVRYEFMQRIAAQRDCTYVAVAHTADDQAETILHHLIRGSGISGLRGIPRTRALSPGVHLIRPMLSITRRQVEEYLAALDQGFRHDKSNADSAYTRNRVRNELIPLIERDFNPRIREVLNRLGAQAADIEAALHELAAPILENAVLEKSETIVRLNNTVLQDQPRHLIRTCFTVLWSQLNWPKKHMTYADWDSLATISVEGGATSLPGNIEARNRGKLIILRR